MIINGIKLNDVKVDKSEKTELSERDNKIIGWVSLALVTLLLIAFFLGGFFSPVRASASELVGGDVPIETPYDNYLVLEQTNHNYYFVCVNYSVIDSVIKFDYCHNFQVSGGLEPVIKALQSGSIGKYSDTIAVTKLTGSYDILYSSSDFSCGDVSFRKTPCLIHKETTVGGLQAPEIATALTSQIVGLVPLVLGLLVLAIGLWKGLKHLRQTLSRA